MVVAVYLNTFAARVFVVGPFETSKEADKYIRKQTEPQLWNIKVVHNP